MPCDLVLLMGNTIVTLFRDFRAFIIFLFSSLINLRDGMIMRSAWSLKSCGYRALVLTEHMRHSRKSSFLTHCTNSIDLHHVTFYLIIWDVFLCQWSDSLVFDHFVREFCICDFLKLCFSAIFSWPMAFFAKFFNFWSFCSRVLHMRFSENFVFSRFFFINSFLSENKYVVIILLIDPRLVTSFFDENDMTHLFIYCVVGDVIFYMIWWNGYDSFICLLRSWWRHLFFIFFTFTRLIIRYCNVWANQISICALHCFEQGNRTTSSRRIWALDSNRASKIAWALLCKDRSGVSSTRSKRTVALFIFLSLRPLFTIWCKSIPRLPGDFHLTSRLVINIIGLWAITW